MTPSRCPLPVRRRAGVAKANDLRGGNALQRMPPSIEPGMLLLQPSLWLSASVIHCEATSSSAGTFMQPRIERA